MAQSLSKIYIHLVFHVKASGPKIREEDMERVHAYVGRLIQVSGNDVVVVGGTSDHVHILFQLSKNDSVAHVAEEVKRNSSRRLKTIDEHDSWLQWQGGYGALSVSQSVVDKTIQYIKSQPEHHKRYSFREEYIEFLKQYGIEYNEKYIFEE